MNPIQRRPGWLQCRQTDRLQRGRSGQLAGGLLVPLQTRCEPAEYPLPAVVAQDAIMADADQTAGKNVPAEAAQELAGAQREGLDLAALTVMRAR